MAGDIAPDVLTVGVAGRRLALPAALVREVLRPLPLTRVPGGPAALLGLAGLRGGVLPVLSLARLVARPGDAAMPEGAPSAATRIVVVGNGAPVGLLVGSVARLGQDAGAETVDLAMLLDATSAASAGRPGGGGVSGLDGPGPDGSGSARPAAGEAEALALVAFGIGGQDYALPMDRVAEVTRLPAAVTSLPGTALPANGEAILGVVPHRGGLLPLVSLRALLGFAPGGMDAATRVVVTQVGRHRAGLVVDSVRAILRVSGSAVEPLPPLLTRGLGEARVAAILRLEGGMRLVSILSVDGLFDEATTARLGVGLGVAEGLAQPALASRPDAPSDARAGTAAGPGAARFVVFRLGGEHYGLPVEAVDEVARHPGTLARIPHAPGFVQGAMNLRGAVLPVIDQRRRFGVANSGSGLGSGPEVGGQARIVVVAAEGLRAGFAVDAVSEILSVPAAGLFPVPPLAGGEAGVFDRVARPAGGGRVILLADPGALIEAAGRDLLAGFAGRIVEPGMAAP